MVPRRRIQTALSYKKDNERIPIFEHAGKTDIERIRFFIDFYSEKTQQKHHEKTLLERFDTRFDEILQLLHTGQFESTLPTATEASEQFDADDFLAAGMIDEEEDTS